LIARNTEKGRIDDPAFFVAGQAASKIRLQAAQCTNRKAKFH
jgi:hypothetical protein